MPNEALSDDKGNPYYGFLAELRSIGGLSGSPVFVYLDNYRVYTPNIEGGNYQLSLLGLIRGHWDLEKKLADSDIAEDISLGFSKGEKMNVGIAIITPAIYILAMLQNEQFKAERKKLIDRDMIDNSSILDSNFNNTGDNFIE